MVIVFRYLVFQLFIILPFILGYFFKKKYPQAENNVKKIVKLNLLTFQSLLFFLSCLKLQLNRSLVVLPISGMLIVITGFVIGMCFVRIFSFLYEDRVNFQISASLGNHGFTMGGFICYLILDEIGLNYSVLFVSYFTFYFSFFLFPYARSKSKSNLQNNFGILSYIIQDYNLSFVFIVSGLILNYFGLKAEYFSFIPLNLILYISVSIQFFSLGLTFHFNSIGQYIKAHVVLGSIKFLLLPFFVISVLHFTNFSEIIEKVIIIEAFMPVAVFSVITSALFDHNTRYASSLFVVNTLVFIVIVLPFIFIFLS